VREHLARRVDSVSLESYRALVTGGRIKIGHETALKLLRAGADVHVTTRYPHDAAARVFAQPDWHAWRQRIHIHGLDLRALPDLQHWIEALDDALPSLDILVNNAAQTVRKPPAHHALMLARDAQARAALPTAVRRRVFPSLERAIPSDAIAALPQVMTGRDGDPVDLRPSNSWRQVLGEVPVVEILETHVVNAVAPAMLVQGLLPALRRSENPHRFVVNVSAVEGQFSRGTKTAHHPHTNMAKAALNMLTRTSARALARMSIFMNSVDTGWVTDMRPAADLQTLEARRPPPLDVVDGAARLCQPIFEGVAHGRPRHGLF